MKALIIKHVESEGPGSIGEFLASKGASVKTTGLHSGEKLPSNPSDIHAIISMGGPMNVYEEDKYPFLIEEAAFLRKSINADIPVMGICLGAQMIAKTCNALVKKAPMKEIGWSEVALTPEGCRDNIFCGLSASLPVFQWHEDTFDIPIGAKLLATSKSCPHQAFRYRNAYGFQFHIEVTREILSSWFDEPKQREEILRVYEDLESEIKNCAARICANFMALAG